MELNWIDKSSFEMGGYVITLHYVHGGSQRKSSDRDFTIMKAPHFLPHYTELQGGGFDNVIELGVYQGGSLVFLDQLLKPKKMSAIELSTTPIPALDKYVSERTDRIKMHYGTSQDDVAALNKIVENEFGGTLDLVVDDASHFYDQTKTSFATLFPKVRPAGMYIIEDWSWGFEDAYQSPTNGWFQVPAPPTLIIDLMEEMVVTGMISDIQIHPALIKIRRSHQPAAPVFQKQARRGRVLTPL